MCSASLRAGEISPLVLLTHGPFLPGTSGLGISSTLLHRRLFNGACAAWSCRDGRRLSASESKNRRSHAETRDKATPKQRRLGPGSAALRTPWCGHRLRHDEVRSSPFKSRKDKESELIASENGGHGATLCIGRCDSEFLWGLRLAFFGHAMGAILCTVVLQRTFKREARPTTESKTFPPRHKGPEVLAWARPFRGDATIDSSTTPRCVRAYGYSGRWVWGDLAPRIHGQWRPRDVRRPGHMVMARTRVSNHSMSCEPSD